tara:strand:- start:366 stop:734 length:369 start_codon:yes stop_codon:yes gene_type:complete
MKIIEKSISKYIEIDEGIITQIQKDFIEKSESWIEELLHFSESISLTVELTEWEEEDEKMVSFFRELVLEIYECIVSVEKNISLVEMSIPSKVHVDAAIKHRLNILMYLSSCLGILENQSKK